MWDSHNNTRARKFLYFTSGLISDSINGIDLKAGHMDGRMLQWFSLAYWMWIRSCFFIPPTRGGLRGHTYKPLQGKSHRRRRGPALNQVWTEVFLTTTPTNVHHFYLLPSSLFCLYGFLRPVVAKVFPLKLRMIGYKKTIQYEQCSWWVIIYKPNVFW